MKRTVFLFVSVVLVPGYFQAQSYEKTASQTERSLAIQVTCNSDPKGLTYRDPQNLDAIESSRCSYNPSIEIFTDKSADHLIAQTKNSELVNAISSGISQRFFKPNYQNPNTINSYLGNDSLWISERPTQLKYFPLRFGQTTVSNLFPAAQTRDSRRFELSGAASIGFSNSHVTTETSASSPVSDPTSSKSRELNLGLDLHFGTYLLDRRFITFSADASFASDKGAFEDYETRHGIRGFGFAVEFLPTSPYPFRFRYVDQNTNFLDRFGQTTDLKHSILGFNWQLRKPKFPTLAVSYDRVIYDSKFAAAPFFNTKAETISIAAVHSFRDWDLNSGYNYQSTDEKLTGLKTRQNFGQVHARKVFSKTADLFIGSFFEKIHFVNNLNGTEQNITLFDVYSDFNYRPTKRFDNRLSHHFYYNDNNSGNLSTGGGNSFVGLDTKTNFNSFGDYLNFRILPELSMGVAANLNFINSPGGATESTAQIHDFALTVSWKKTLKPFDFYVHALEGAVYAGSNFGNHRSTEFRSFNAGANFGNVQRVHFSAGYNYSYRPDIFQIGGYFSENNFTFTATTEALSPFRLQASGGTNHTVYLTSRGREDFTRTFYSAGVEHRRFTFQFARNSNDGLRDIYASNFLVPANRVFIVLPRDILIRDPFLRTRGESTSAMFRTLPYRDLTIEARYVDDRAFFVSTNDVAVRQLDVVAYYKLGKFIFSCGYSRQNQVTEGAFSRKRDYTFCRATRTFKIY